MSLTKNSIYNLLGMGLPLIAAFLSIPKLIEALGVDGFGLLALMWAIVSYFSIFDLGIGRALTLKVSKLLAENDNNKNDEIKKYVDTGVVLMTFLGIVGAIILICFKDMIARGLQTNITEREFYELIVLMAIALPFTVVTSGYRGVIEAYNRFDIVNLIRFPMGLFTFLGPLSVVELTDQGIVGIGLVLTIGRIIAWYAHYYYASKMYKFEKGPLLLHTQYINTLITSGGWITVSNVVSPLMGYIDRFMIGAVLGASAVTYYATSLEIVTKIWIIPGAIAAALFPMMAASLVKKHNENSTREFKMANEAIFLTVFPLSALLYLFSQEILSIWIDKEFANKSAVLLEIFSFGILVNCMAHIPFTTIQSAGKAKFAALIHCAELLIYVASLWIAIHALGVMGVAMIWALRMLIDTILMYCVAIPIVYKNRYGFLTKWGVVALTLVCCLFGSKIVMDMNLGVRITLMLLVIVVSATRIVSLLVLSKPEGKLAQIL